ncbi:MAG: sugar ABC transporter permease [Firmicutes bacterium]|nr:sugar ABC transporter permease [Bacillota bacterium]
MERSRFPNKVLPYLLLIPAAVSSIIFIIIPAAQSLYQSFFFSHPFTGQMRYVGLKHYQSLFSDPEYLNSVRITFVFSAFVVIVGMGLSLLLSVLLSKRIRGVSYFQLGLLWPYALSPAMAATLWALLTHPSIGPISHFLEFLIGKRMNWITDAFSAQFMLIIASIWKNMGYNIVFFLAGLANIPRDFSEAARIDGAGPLREFFTITFPLLSPVTFFLVVTNILYALFDIFPMVDLLTRGGPGRSTDLLIYKLYRDGFLNFNIGIASAQSVILFVVVSILTLLIFKFGSSRIHYQ